MEQNQFDLDQLRQIWSSTEKTPTSEWISDEEISQMVSHTNRKMRHHGMVALMTVVLFAVGISRIIVSSNDVCTNQSGLDHSQVVSILDDAWEEMNQEFTSI